MSVKPIFGLQPWQSTQSLDKAADALNAAAKEAAKEPGQWTRASGAFGKEAASNAKEAVLDAARGVGHAVAGTAGVLVGADFLVVGGVGGATLGAGAWTVEEGLKGAAWLAHNQAKGLTKLANLAFKAAGSSEQYTCTKILGDPAAEKLSKKLFRFAGDSVKEAAEFKDFSFDQYAKAFDFGVVGTIGNLSLAAGNAALMGVCLGGAAVSCGEVGAIKMAELSVRAAKLAMMAAQAGTLGAAEALLLSAKASAAVGNFLQHSSDPTYKITAQQVAALEQQLQAVAA